MLFVYDYTERAGSSNQTEYDISLKKRYILYKIIRLVLGVFHMVTKKPLISPKKNLKAL
jgi:hypothetical protein